MVRLLGSAFNGPLAGYATIVHPQQTITKSAAGQFINQGARLQFFDQNVEWSISNRCLFRQHALYFGFNQTKL